jgi:hypothetical protein
MTALANAKSVGQAAYVNGQINGLEHGIARPPA